MVLLLIEPEKDWHNVFRGCMPEVEILSALDFGEALKVFEARKEDIDVIAVSSFGTSDSEYVPRVLALVKKIRAPFAGPIIGMSVIPEYRKILFDDGKGCTQTCKKEELMEVIRQLPAR